ncbi:MAG: DMT family protein [Bacteroidales bacterium]|nr:DMT family protein [Bacteroidales bacterium]
MLQKGILTVLMLVVSNTFMTLAWYGHLRVAQIPKYSNMPLYAVILFSWLIALAEYSFQVPANRIGFDSNGGPFSLIQLKVIQEALSLIVFTVVSGLLFGSLNLHWNHILAFILLIISVALVFYK